jgi:hypothetical protein
MSTNSLLQPNQGPPVRKGFLFVVGSATAGVIILAVVLAAGTPNAFEPETGALAAGAATTTLTGQSGTGVVKFAGGLSPTPTPGVCSGAKHTPDGPDGFGGCWPGPQSTGIPAGTVLTNYTGPSGYQDPGTMVIDKKTVNSELRFYGHANVTITNSKINGHIDFDLTDATSTLTIRDSELDAGGYIGAVLGNRRWNAIRINVHGGTTGVNCAGDCTLTDSWIHGSYLPTTGDYHLGGFLSNGGDNINSIHNSIFCDAGQNPSGGNCSGDFNMFGDFAPISHVTVDRTLIGANQYISYCLYGGDAPPGGKPYPESSYVVIKNSIMQKGVTGKCGGYGGAANFNPARIGNQWINNYWDDGTVLESTNW